MPSDPAPLDDGDKMLMAGCPFSMFIPDGNRSRLVAARLKRMRSLVIKGLLHGKVADRVRDGYNYEITLTDAGRVALTNARRAGLGLPPKPPAP